VEPVKLENGPWKVGDGDGGGDGVLRGWQQSVPACRR